MAGEPKRTVNPAPFIWTGGGFILILAVGLPQVLFMALGQLIGNQIWPLVLAAGIGAALCALIGSAFGKRQEVGWPFVVGANLGPGFMLFMLALKGRSMDPFAILVLSAYILGGAALAAGFFVGRKSLPATGETMPSGDSRT